MFIELLNDAAVTLGKTVAEDWRGVVRGAAEGEVDTPELHWHITHLLY